MPDDPLIYPGDLKRDEPIERRPEDEAEREARVDRSGERGTVPDVRAHGDERTPASDPPAGEQSVTPDDYVRALQRRQ